MLDLRKYVGATNVPKIKAPANLANYYLAMRRKNKQKKSESSVIMSWAK